MDIMLYVMVFGPMIVGPALLIAGIIWFARDLFVKRPRRIRWCEKHPDHLIGDDYWMRWCRENDIDGSYFI